MLSCVIFDLDGVLVSTDEYHYLAWKVIADELAVPFNRTDNLRQRGVSRMESLDVVLGKCSKAFGEEQKLELATRKNDIYLQMLNEHLDPSCVLPGVLETLQMLKAMNICCAVGSSSRNTAFILEKTMLAPMLDPVVGGMDITRSKPDPEVFVLAGRRAGFLADQCLVVEDAVTGIEAGLAAGMRVMAVGAAHGNTLAQYSFVALDDPACNWAEIAANY